MIIELRDNGPEFDPSKIPVVGSVPSQDRQAIGGWGIPLVLSYIDELRYRREAGENVLRLTKWLADNHLNDDFTNEEKA